MIKNIRIDNCYSFRDPVLINLDGNKVTCLFGGNGSGKTNLLWILHSITKWVDSTQRTTKFVFPPEFRLSSRRKKYSRMGIDFILGEDEFSYTVVFTKDGACEEELRYNNKLVINESLDSDLGILSDIEKERINTYDLRNKSIIGLLAFDEIVVGNTDIRLQVKLAYEFFTKKIIFLNTSDLATCAEILHKNLIVKNEVLRFLTHINAGITDIITAESEFEQNELADMIMNRDFENNYVRIINGSRILANFQKYRIADIYYGSKKLSYNLISDGLQSLIKILIIIFSNEDHILICDEIEKNIHEFVTSILVRYMKQNCYQSILTTHLVDIMTFEHFSKKEIFLLHIDSDHKTNVRRLSSFSNLRQDDRNSFRNLYRNGKLEGYPVIEGIYDKKK